MKCTKLSFLIALLLAAFIFTGCPSNNNSQTAAASEIVEEEEEEDDEYEDDDDGDDEWDDLDSSEVDYDYSVEDSIQSDTVDF